jgi:hypothetical protein
MWNDTHLDENMQNNIQKNDALLHWSQEKGNQQNASHHKES